MKFNCPKCKKAFAVSPKMAGKTLRVRCTSCGSVFKMRVAVAEGPKKAPVAPAPQAQTPEPQAQTPEPQAQTPTPQAQTPEPQAQTPTAQAPRPRPLHKYFAVVSGKRLGPMPSSALVRLIHEEKVTRTTLAWRKGLAQWLPAQRIPELRKLFIDEPPPLADAPPPIPETPEPPPTLADFKDKGSVKGEVLSHLRPVVPDEEPTDEEVVLDAMDQQFFSAGQEEGVDEGVRGLDEIELSDGPMFPVELEQQFVEKGAKASLADFSVMVRISKRSRAKSVGVVAALAVTAVLSIVLIFTFGDPLGWAAPEKEEVEMTEADFRFGREAVEHEQNKRKKEAAAPQKKKEQETEKWDEADDLVKAMHEKEWRVTLDDEEMAIDRRKLASQFRADDKKQEKKKVSGNGGGKEASGAKKKTTRKQRHEEPDDDGEMSLEEYAMRQATRENEGVGNLISAAAGTNGKKGKEKIADEMSSSMGGLLGSKMTERKVTASVKEREGDGSALKAIVARRVGKKVGGERKKLQYCVETHGFQGSGGKLRASLHFSEKGIVSRVTIKGGSSALQSCFTSIFKGWQISMINRKIKIPIAVRFE